MATCTTPIPGSTLGSKTLQGGTVTQLATSYTKNFTGLDTLSQYADAKSDCESKYGIAKSPTNNTSSLTCKLPKIISYKASAGSFRQGECENTYNGDFVSNLTSADLCIIR